MAGDASSVEGRGWNLIPNSQNPLPTTRRPSPTTNPPPTVLRPPGLLGALHNPTPQPPCVSSCATQKGFELGHTSFTHCFRPVAIHTAASSNLPWAGSRRRVLRNMCSHTFLDSLRGAVGIYHHRTNRRTGFCQLPLFYIDSRCCSPQSVCMPSPLIILQARCQDWLSSKPS